MCGDYIGDNSVLIACKRVCDFMVGVWGLYVLVFYRGETKGAFAVFVLCTYKTRECPLY